VNEDELAPEDFDAKLNAIYAAGYHDGAFPSEPTYSKEFEEIREAMLKHDAALRARAGAKPEKA
jgi:hypothetical protein